MVNKTVEILNTYKGTDKVSDMIEIEVPFCSSSLERSKKPFVIFDTPGSNTATNTDHVEVLKNAMKSMSNGLPIFVAEYNDLDSTDNETLFRTINEIDELDSRFTMIIANRADASDLPPKGFSETDEKEILRQTIPSNLYANGIFFVSSIMGLRSSFVSTFSFLVSKCNVNWAH